MDCICHFTDGLNQSLVVSVVQGIPKGYYSMHKYNGAAEKIVLTQTLPFIFAEKWVSLLMKVFCSGRLTVPKHYFQYTVDTNHKSSISIMMFPTTSPLNFHGGRKRY